jgi:VWFA-related protein
MVNFIVRRSSLNPARWIGRALVWCFILVLMAPGAAHPEQQNTPPAADQQKLPPPTGQALKVSIEIVNVYAIVRAKKGRLIPNLNKEDFEVTEDNAAQEIRYFSRETDTPLTLGMMIDTSPSQQHVLPMEKEEGKRFVSQVLRPKDLAFVLHFDLDAELLQDFTSDTRLLARALDETVINGGGQGPVPSTFPTGIMGATHLYDAVYLASSQLLKNEIGRKVLILLSDGQDEGSRMKLEDALEAAQKADVIIYSVDISDRMFYRGQGVNFIGDSVLRKLSEETGGRVIEVRRQKDTSAAFEEIANELRTQYLIGYTPSNTRHDGSYRKIRVHVPQGDCKVQARRGYYAPAE